MKSGVLVHSRTSSPSVDDEKTSLGLLHEGTALHDRYCPSFRGDPTLRLNPIIPPESSQPRHTQSLPSVSPLLITSDAFDLDPTYLSTTLPSVDSTGTTEILAHGNPRQRVSNSFRPAKLPSPPSSAILLLPPKPAVAIQIPKSPLFTRRDLPATEDNRFSDSSTPQRSSLKAETPLDSAGTPLTLSLPVATPENAQDAPGPVEFRAPVQNTSTVSDDAVEHSSSDKQAQVTAQWYKPAPGRTARGMCAHDWGKRIDGHRQDFEIYWRGLPKNNPNEFQ
ncbi:hypothetical protein V5O48_017540, partial [Marasmius crinis-equi]